MALGTTFGLTPNGLVPKQIADITADLNAAMQSAFGNSINLAANSRFGQIVGIIAERYLELWNLATQVHAAFNPDLATSQDLVNVAAITGTLPVIPTSSTVTATCTGTPGTVLSLGRVCAVSGTGTLWNSTAAATITAVTVWAAYTAVLGDRRTNVGNVYQCIQAGTSVTGPTGTGSSISDGGTALWQYLGVGTGAIDVPFASQLVGQQIAAAGTLTVINTPVAGWNNVTNLAAAVLGAALESDPVFRVRRESELRGPGKSAVEAVRAALTKTLAVTAATVFENVTDVVNSDGMPPHSIECLVQGGAASDIANAIWQNKAGGINTTGNQASVPVIDSQGISHNIFYSRPVVVPIWIIVNILADATKWPSDGVNQVTNNLLAYGGNLVPDLDIFSGQLAAAIMSGVPNTLGLYSTDTTRGIPGVLDPGQPSPLIGLAANPNSTNTVSITSRQLGQFAAARILVNVSFGVP